MSTEELAHKLDLAVVNLDAHAYQMPAGRHVVVRQTDWEQLLKLQQECRELLRARREDLRPLYDQERLVQGL